MKLRTLSTLLAIAAVAAACGGGSDDNQTQAAPQGAQQAGPADARARIAAVVASANRRTIQATTTAVDSAAQAKALFDFGEASYPDLFPSKRPDMVAENWRYRFYPETGIFLVVSEGRVYLLGGPFGDQVLYVGQAQDILNPPSTVVVNVSLPASGKLAWNSKSAAQFSLINTNGLAVQGPYTCTSDAPASIEVAADCSTVTARRLGTHTISVAQSGIVGKASVKVVPPAQPLGTSGNAKYNVVVTPDGRALAWGSSDLPIGQGTILGSSVGFFLPVAVKAPTGDALLTGVVAAAAGDSQAFALTEDGELYSWGAATALGRNATAADKRAGKVLDPAGTAPLKGIVAVSTGTTNALALADDGTVYAWGDTTASTTPDPKKLPVVVAGSKAVAIASGALWNAALLTDGTVATWGRNVEGSLGQGTAAEVTLKPGALLDDSTGKALTGVVSLSAGFQHGFAMTTDNRVYAWGRNSSGQLGRGDRGETNRAIRAVTVSNPLGNGIWTGARMVAAGGNHSVALDSTGKAFSWGFSASGELGDGMTKPRTEAQANLPGPVLAAAGTEDQLSDVVAVAAGYAHSMALLSDGRLMIWGSGFNGILGQGGSSTSRSAVPLAVKNEVGSTTLNLGPITYWPNLQRRATQP